MLRTLPHIKHCTYHKIGACKFVAVFIGFGTEFYLFNKFSLKLRISDSKENLHDHNSMKTAVT